LRQKREIARERTNFSQEDNIYEGV